MQAENMVCKIFDLIFPHIFNTQDIKGDHWPREEDKYSNTKRTIYINNYFKY